MTSKFPNEIKRLRLAAGLSVAELAVPAGLSPSTVTSIERGNVYPNVGSLLGIASVLQVTVLDLVPWLARKTRT